MTFLVKGSRHRLRAQFPRRTNIMTASSFGTSPTASTRAKLDELSYEPRSDTETVPGSFTQGSGDTDIVDDDFIDEEIPRQFGTSDTMSAKTAIASMIPDMFTSLPLIRDILQTETSLDQDETVQEVLPYLSGLEEDLNYNSEGVPHLFRDNHIRFLHKSVGPLPAPYVAADASRPWLIYWALTALSTLGYDVSSYRGRVTSTVRQMQNATGGFGGGHGQMSHLAPTYAALLSLVIVGGKEALSIVDRKAMWEWLGAIKHAEGGFHMSVGGEVDVRGAYCAAVLISLLDLPLELPDGSLAKSRGLNTLLDGLPEYVARCQTFEGGIAARPDAEAHGAYAFCALACLAILGEPSEIIPKYMDLPLLISWLSARQYGPEGGFAGRTNKLVDGCYSHWIGGCWPLIEAALEKPATPNTQSVDADCLYSKEGLIRYILCACQDTSRRGGLRDKPSKMSDGYHSCYVLAGLSSAQHKWKFNRSRSDTIAGRTLAAPYQWTCNGKAFGNGFQVYDAEDHVEVLHPVFVVPEGHAEEARAYYASLGGFRDDIQESM